MSYTKDLVWIEQQKTELQQEMVDFLEGDLKDMLANSYDYMCDRFGDTKEADEQYKVIMDELVNDADRSKIESAVCNNSLVTDELIQYVLETYDYFFGYWCNFDDFDVVLEDDTLGESIAMRWREGCPKDSFNLLKQGYIGLIDGRFDLILDLKE